MSRSTSSSWRRGAVVTALVGGLAFAPAAGAMAHADAPAKPAGGKTVTQIQGKKPNKGKGKRPYVIKRYDTFDGKYTWHVTVWSNGKVTKVRGKSNVIKPPKPKPDERVYVVKEWTEFDGKFVWHLTKWSNGKITKWKEEGDIIKPDPKPTPPDDTTPPGPITPDPLD
ncbi:hypothetical protein G5C51_05035 [Streptomyces sp. A7024]|uniref:Secreted protein n=1 Tax=Streptomyces coryli TaxID=1128680 RepID=A0A6G4TW92_9ACTN|nr:hypothetical protein [Streptomyces coryli]NGN63271.1 hypothetical protein [Streptomyces coryli]